MPFRHKTWHGWLMAIITLVAFSSAPPVTKAALTWGADPTALMAVRYLVSILLLAGTIRVSAPERFRMDRNGLLICVTAGLAYGAAVLLFVWSLTRISASVASMIFASYPLAVLALLTWRGEKLTYRHTIRLVLGLGGVYLLIGPGGQVDLLGTLLVIGSCCTFSVHLVLMQWFLKDYDARTVTLYMVATMAAVTAGLWLAQGAAWPNFGWHGLLAVGWLAVVATYLAQMTLFAGVRGIGSGQMALLGPLETLLTVTWSLLFLGEHLTALQWLGGTMILSSMLLAVQRLRRSQLSRRAK